jgi:hypothetical protein
MTDRAGGERWEELTQQRAAHTIDQSGQTLVGSYGSHARREIGLVVGNAVHARGQRRQRARS